jgi:DNA-binding SARP family transcriptional activator
VHGREPVVVTARRQQVLLALLLLNGNRVVRLESMRDALWGADPPATARSQVQTCISSLRRTLTGAGLGDRIRVRGTGYAIELAPQELDLTVFDDLALRGRSALAANRPQVARTAFRSALALWRGEPLAGIDSAVVAASRLRIAERRVELIEDCFDAELELGQHREVVGEMLAMVAEHPLRERFVGQLMTALYRCGRQVEALAAYRELRRTFVEELGLEPGPEVRQLHQDILTEALAGGPPTATAPAAEPAPARVAPAGPVPRMLPARLPYFTGHAELVDDLCRQLTDDRGPERNRTVVVTGPAGVGKSTVAIEAAHTMLDAFPDGQLYARLTGGNLADVLERFLHALGVPAAEVPADLEGRTACYRSAIAGRRLLTVLEDVTDVTRVGTLVPTTPGCRLVVTTRSRTAALPGTGVVELAVLGGPAGIELLTTIVGQDRVCAELWAADELVQLCGGLHRAVVAAAAGLATRPHWTIAHLVARLRNERQRLDQLAELGVDVRADLDGELAGVSPMARRLFARMGLLEAGSYAAWVAEPLLDLDTPAAADALEALVDARLVDVTSGTGSAARYRLPELARVFARERLAAEPGADESAATLRRLFGAWLCLTDEARLRGGGERVGTRGGAPRWPLAEPVLDAVLADPAAWYDQEHAAVLATVRLAARVDAVEHCWNLAVAVADLAGGGRRLADWRESNECALRVAVRAGDRLGEATLHHLLGELDLREHRHPEAAARISLARDMFAQLGEAGRHDLVRRSLAVVDQARDDASGPTSGQPATPAATRAAGEYATGSPGTLRPHHFELAGSTDLGSGLPDGGAQGRSRSGRRRRIRPRPSPARRQTGRPEER